MQYTNLISSFLLDSVTINYNMAVVQHAGSVGNASHVYSGDAQEFLVVSLGYSRRTLGKHPKLETGSLPSISLAIHYSLIALPFDA